MEEHSHHVYTPIGHFPKNKKRSPHATTGPPPVNTKSLVVMKCVG